MRDPIHSPIARLVKTEEDVEHLRRLRNHCRAWMTRHQCSISPKQQKAWWQNRPGSMQAYLYYVDEIPVGFGLLRYDHENWWATLGLLKTWRSRGIGTWIYQHLVSQTPGSLWIEVRSDNTRSLKAATRAGFIMQEVRDECTILAIKKERE